RSLADAAVREDDILVCFNTGIIVPRDVLSRYRSAFNFHAASPDFPGRDPHHWAIYRGAKRFGVTAHIMTEKVDDGPIVSTASFASPENCAPQELRALAYRRLIELFVKCLRFDRLVPTGHVWGPNKSTRAKLLQMCDLSGVDPA